MSLRFHKYEGAGNDFVLLECVGAEEIPRLGSLAQKICDRHFGIGADGLVLVWPDQHADAGMAIFNADGSRADMCGNALRCVGKHLLEGSRRQVPAVTIKTDQGLKSVERATSAYLASGYTTELGRPRLDREDIPMLGGPGMVMDEEFRLGGLTFPITALFLGNPHVVVFRESLDRTEVRTLGAAIENHPRFPRRTNVNFVRIQSPGEVEQRTFERGVGETLACGTGAGAVCVAGVLTGRLNPSVMVHQPGGDLLIHWPNREASVSVSGQARRVFSGEWPES